MSVVFLSISVLLPPFGLANTVYDEDTHQLAEQLNLLPAIDRIHTLKTLSKDKQTLNEKIELLELHQDLYARIIRIQLEINDVLARIDKDTALATASGFIMGNRQAKALRLNSLANLLGTGSIGLVASGIAITRSPASGMVGLAASGVNTGFSGAAYLLQRYHTSEITELKYGRMQPNMLTQLFDKPVDLDHKYPESVWHYLNDKPVNSMNTRRENLIGLWIDLGRIKKLSGTTAEKKIGEITGTSTTVKGINLNILMDRTAMLYDTRTLVFRMSGLVLNIIKAVE